MRTILVLTTSVLFLLVGCCTVCNSDCVVVSSHKRHASEYMDAKNDKNVVFA